jgi:hypothetical protein
VAYARGSKQLPLTAAIQQGGGRAEAPREVAHRDRLLPLLFSVAVSSLPRITGRVGRLG